MAKKLYVGNLARSVTTEQLRDLFAEVGEISDVTIITDRETGESRGFAFIEMASEAEAKEAIKRFNGHMIENRAMAVSEARPREERSGGGGGGRRDQRRGGGGRRWDY